jgi:hypothetical protein
MIVEVYFHGVHMATVNAQDADSEEAALEFAWRYTQNIDGSWSRYGSPDWHPTAMTVHAPLPVHNGKTYGHRSSMVGDRFKIGARAWLVGSMGFKEVTDA